METWLIMTFFIITSPDDIRLSDFLYFCIRFEGLEALTKSSIVTSYCCKQKLILLSQEIL